MGPTHGKRTAWHGLATPLLDVAYVIRIPMEDPAISLGCCFLPSSLPLSRQGFGEHMGSVAGPGYPPERCFWHGGAVPHILTCNIQYSWRPRSTPVQLSPRTQKQVLYIVVTKLGAVYYNSTISWRTCCVYRFFSEAFQASVSIAEILRPIFEFDPTEE